MVNFRRWERRADLLVWGSTEPFATRRSTVRACAGLLASVGAMLLLVVLIFGQVDRAVWQFPVTFAVVFPLIGRWYWRRQQRRD